MGKGYPVGRDEHTEAVKRLEEAIAATPRSEWIRYPSYAAYMRALDSQAA